MRNCVGYLSLQRSAAQGYSNYVKRKRDSTSVSRCAYDRKSKRQESGILTSNPSESPPEQRLSFKKILFFKLKKKIFIYWGTWVAQSVEHPTSAQVMISRFASSNPMSGSVLTARILEPASDSVSPSPSAPPPLTVCLSLSHK